MEKIYSRTKLDTLLHIIVKKKDFIDGRQDIIDADQFLQCSMLGLNKGKTFAPHEHIWKDGPQRVIAQESWVCIHGSVKCIFYDLNGELLAERIIEAGDASFTLQGGHNYECLEDDSQVLEFKVGPYQGQELDKVFI